SSFGEPASRYYSWTGRRRKKSERERLVELVGVNFSFSKSGGSVMKIRLAIAIILLSAIRLLAHHSFAAEFDASKAVRLTGALSKIEWTNPHTYFYIDVKEDNGNLVKWGCEAGSPGALTRRGFKRGDIKLGDTIIVDGYRAKDGSRLIDA